MPEPTATKNTPDTPNNEVIKDSKNEESSPTKVSIETKNGDIEVKEVIETNEITEAKEVTETKEVTEAKEVTETKEKTETKEVTETKEKTETKEVTEAKEVTETKEITETKEVTKENDCNTKKIDQDSKQAKEDIKKFQAIENFLKTPEAKDPKFKHDFGAVGEVDMKNVEAIELLDESFDTESKDIISKDIIFNCHACQETFPNPLEAKKCFESHLNQENCQNLPFANLSKRTVAKKPEKEDKKEGTNKRKASPEPFSILEEKLSKLKKSETEASDFEKA